MDYFDSLLRDIQQSNISEYLQPVALVLLDINMPIMTGLEAVKSIKGLFDRCNEELEAEGRNSLIRPVIMYFTQYNR